jgi:predicted nucleotide-binding protein
MPRCSTQPPPPKTANLTVEEMTRGISRLQKRIADLDAFDPQSVQEGWPPDVKALEASIAEALAATFGHGTIDYNRYKRAATLDNGPVMVSSPDWLARSAHADHSQTLKARQYLSEGKRQAILLLQQAIRGLEERIAEQRESSPSGATTNSKPQKEYPRKVFVVHGHDDGAREAVARFLEQIGFEPIILHEQASKGRTIIEKVEAHGHVGFAVILLTPDDEGCKKGEALKPRARQNVVLELGYFLGRLGREKVCALRRGDVEIPSDFGGVIYETFDSGGGWKQALGRELKETGFDIDWNKVMR